MKADRYANLQPSEKFWHLRRQRELRKNPPTARVRNFLARCSRERYLPPDLVEYIGLKVADRYSGQPVKTFDAAIPLAAQQGGMLYGTAAPVENFDLLRRNLKKATSKSHPASPELALLFTSLGRLL